MCVRADRSPNEENGEVLAQVLPGQGQVVAVELQGFHVVMQVKVSIAQLTVDGAQHLQVLCANLDGSFKEGDARPVVTGFAEALALQRQLQAGHLHPTAGKRRESLNTRNQDKIKPERSSRDSSLGETHSKLVWSVAAKTLSRERLSRENVVYLPLSH